MPRTARKTAPTQSTEKPAAELVAVELPAKPRPQPKPSRYASDVELLDRAVAMLKAGQAVSLDGDSVFGTSAFARRAAAGARRALAAHAPDLKTSVRTFEPAATPEFPDGGFRYGIYVKDAVAAAA